MPSPAHAAPPKLGSPEAFTALGGWLDTVGFTEQAVCERLGLKGKLDVQALRGIGPVDSTPWNALELVARMFVAGDAFDGAIVEKLIPAEVGEALRDLGLLAPWVSHPEKLSACAAFYPVGGVLIASDRWNHPDRAPFRSFGDIVYPAISPNTRRFLELLPDEPCERFLDLCSGTGVAALIAARRYARHAWAADLTERCNAFTEFNRRLNGLENVTVVRGDLYEPVRGIQFDRIVAHPPYMPTLESAEIYYDGGPDGEHVTSRIVAQAPESLATGGRVYCLTMGSDREGEMFEQRIRRWLGAASQRCNVALVARRFVNPSQFALSSALQAHGGTPQADQWKTLFEQQRIRSLVYGLIVLEKEAADSQRASFTARRAIGEQSTLRETEWLLHWEAAAKDAAMLARLLESRPRASERFELRVTHRIVEGDLIPDAFQLAIEYPFSLECAVPPWTGYLLAACDGARGGRELLEHCKQQRFVHP
ncbi:MAG: methyltransferase, partial [Candidatus Acidiferrales bacterium]